MEKRSRRNDVLLGVFIGIYGNWLIAVVEKLGSNLDLAMAPFALSFGFLVWYFQEAYGNKKHINSWKSKSTVLGVVYFLLVLASLFLTGLVFTELVFVWVGAFLWVALMTTERFFY